MRRTLLFPVLAICIVVGAAAPAGAQQQDGDGDVQIEFETGDFDGERGDWSISVVHVTGSGLDAGQPLTLELKSDDGTVLWTGTEPASATTTSFTVVPFVAVQDVFRAAISQPLPEVAGDVVDRQEVEVRRQGAGGGGGGALALSMVLAVVLMAILFRTPLPSQVSQRWTK
jgi:hypothetical protein